MVLKLRTHESSTVGLAKRTFDVIVSALGLVVSAPLLGVIALAIKLDSDGPIIFRQERVGRHWKPFSIFKFRTMVVSKHHDIPLTLDKDPRVTRVGEFLRRSKLDELPQLMNVLIGDMSLVGPRPEVPSLMRLYSPQDQQIIVSVRPGITDYASILFRHEKALLDGSVDPIDMYRHKIMPIKLVYYKRYVQDMSILCDLKIIAATVFTIVSGRAPKLLNLSHDLKDVHGGVRPV